jgi:hypothetical protein
LVVITLLPQAVSVPAAAAERRPVAARSLTLAEAIKLEQIAEQQREQQLLAEGPADDTELNRMLIQDLADYDEDQEVRAAAAAVLQGNDPAEFTAFLDNALPIYRAAADERKKLTAATNRELVAGWAADGGPIVRERAAAVLATKNDAKIADFVAVGKEAAEAADKQAELNAAEQAKLIKARVEQIVANGGYETRSAGQMALDSEDPAVIAAFYNTGYKAAAARDTEAQTQIEAALAARTKAVDDLADLATRATQAANARKTIIESSVSATKSLTVAANSMLLVNKYAKQADAVYAADLPIRKSGGATHTADLTRLRTDACAEVAVTARNSGQVTAHAGVVDTAAQTLVGTGLSHGVAWAEVTQAQKDAGAAAKLAADTACSAAQATEAAAKALDADRNATVEANNAVKYRQAAERAQAIAAKLADQAEKLAAAAQAAEQDARKQRLRAEEDARQAWAKAAEAEEHYKRAVAQRDIARQQMAIAVTQQAIALSAANKAVEQQKIAGTKGKVAKKAADEVTAAAERFEGLAGEARAQASNASWYVRQRNTYELNRAAHAATAAAKKGTAEGDNAEKQVAIIDAQLPGIRTAADNAKGKATAAATAADVAAGAAQRAAAAAAAARAEAEAAAAAAAGARREAESAAAAASKAIADAQKANEYARQAVNVARAAINQAAKAKANAKLTKSAADAAVQEASVASFQSRVAGRAATNARVFALALADPVASTIDVGSAYAATDNDAAMAVDIANSALLIGAEHSAQAEQHAADADAAAVHAAEMATKAQEQIKPAYEAARKAAADAARAIKASKVAIDAAIGATKEANGAIKAAGSAAEAARAAASYANGAERMAVEAGHDAAVARQAANNARHYANVADKAAKNADKIAKSVANAASAGKKIADAMKSVATEMTKLAENLTGAVDEVAELREAEKRARQTSWMKTWQDQADKFIDKAFSDPETRDYFKAIAESAIGDLGGMWITGLCAMGPPGNSPGDTPDSEEACDMIVDGIKQLIEKPGSLIHAEEWENGEYAKFLGLWTYDIGTLVIPKIGKAGSAIKLLEDGIPAGIAKLLSGELIAGIKTFGAEAMERALKKLGAVKLGKLLEIDIDVPNRLKFDEIEIKLLDTAIDLKGLVDVEKAIRGLPSGGKLIDELENLLAVCKRDSFAPDTRVLLANGKSKSIRNIRAGDKVLATDPSTGQTAGKPVTKLHINLDTDLAVVAVAEPDGDRSALRTTQHHPFWEAGSRQWTDAGDLGSGDSLRTDRGDLVAVTGVRRYDGARWMYNLTVADLHTYYVLAGNTPVLVHNTSGWCIPEAERIGEADLIADGHADTKHAGDFPGMSVKDLEAHVRRTMQDPARVKDLDRGRKAYQSKDGSTIVIHDPNHPDGGTVFRRDPVTIDEYWEEGLV